VLGAALVTILVEDEVARALSTQAKKRSAAWSAAEEQFRYDLYRIYRELTGR
jgi:hypothetical protein